MRILLSKLHRISPTQIETFHGGLRNFTQETPPPPTQELKLFMEDLETSLKNTPLKSWNFS